ncbi:amidohydrolase family protein [Litorivivens sp.]|uniref:N-acyl-D-amino-acid deacylase family protein n=1 Tax=Litorivivens sp. TaxID=2020868 RepID=UPI003562FBA9
MSAQDPTARLIQGGTIVDGTGAPAYRGDLRIANGAIQAIAPELSPNDGEEVVNASGCIVSPGFIESHTHFDGAMWWDQTLDPLPGFGATTVIMGNCGFSVAPVPDDEAVRREVVGIFSFFEDIPESPFMTELPWDWRSWPEYQASMQRNASLPANYAAFCGHIALRLAVMGMEAWERAATADEIERMAFMLDEALAAGALGLSTNLMDHDGENRPVPSLHADDAEFRALFEVMARHPGVSFQVIVDTFRNMAAPDQLERIARLTEGLDIRVQWAGLPTLVFQRDLMGIQAPLAAMHERLKTEGRDFWTGYAHIPVTSTASVQSSLLFAQSNDYVWHEVVLAEGDDAKRALLKDDSWRERARASWDNDVFEFSPFAKARAPHMLLLNSENNAGPIGVTLGEYAKQIGAPHVSDAMAEWLIANGLESTVTMPPFEMDTDMVISLIRDKKSVGNISDAGAHGQMLCGGGENIRLFTEFVAKGQITLEEAVWVQTGKLADHFSLRDRGSLQVGKRADIAVFSLDEIAERDLKKVYDVPMGDGNFTWRWTRDSAPMRLTLVNGLPTFENAAATEQRPGEWVAPHVSAAQQQRETA